MKKSENSKISIRKKILSSFLIVVIVTLIVSFIATQISVIILKNKNEKQLINQAVDSAETFTHGQATAINEQISGVISKITQSARYAEYIYQNPNSFNMKKIPTPDDFTKEVTDNEIHWLPFEKEDAKKPEVVREANLLAGLEPEFKGIMETCPMVVSLYVATKSHVNIGYDKSVLSKKGIGAYNPETAQAKWYAECLKSSDCYISDTYVDTFGRGIMITISVPYFEKGKIHGVIGADIIIENINKDILNIDMESTSGYAMLFSNSGTPISAKGMTEKTTALDLLGTNQAVDNLKNNDSGMLRGIVNGKDSYILHDTIEETGWKLVLVLSVDSILSPVFESEHLIFLIDIVLIVINAVLLIVIALLVNKLSKSLTLPLITLTNDVEKIGEGNLDYSSQIKTADEIQTLSESFEKMTVSLKEHIKNLTDVTKEKERIGAELNVATHIQSSMLPCIFPPFPERKEIDIYATMNPAKEVGGDFYDFFMIDNRHLAIVMADVSGKGVPAALFMVIGKTLIKDHTQLDKDLGEVFSSVNDMLCEANSEGLFITAFEGILDLVTGEFKYVNAGHEMPCIAHSGNPYEVYKIRPGFVLAGMDGMIYKSGSVMLEPGDKIFQYTDGVTEATNAENQLFGMDRMLESLNKNLNASPAELLPAVKKDIDDFVGDAPQFDDITMLSLEYKERMDENGQ